MRQLFLNRIIRVVLFCFPLMLAIAGCESGTGFRTEKKIREQIKGTWQKLDLNQTGIVEEWVFTEDNKLFRIEILTPINDTLDRGEYIISTSLTTAYVTTTGLMESQQLNGKWQITALDEESLTMSYHPDTGGLVQKEFVKKQ